MRVIDKKNWVEDTFFTASVTEIQRALASGCSVDHRDDYGRTPLHWAARYARADLVRLLIARGADTEASTYGIGGTPLFCAVGAFEREGGYSRTETVQALLDGGADLAARNTYKSTPLHWSVSFHGAFHECTQALVEAGAPLDALDERKKRPFDYDPQQEEEEEEEDD